MTQPLVLSLFPGLGLLDLAFTDEGFTVVRGPDILWAQDVRNFHPPAGRFDGLIGGPPCQPFSRLGRIFRANGHQPRHGNLIPDFERCVTEAQPTWFLMEEVPEAPPPSVPSYRLHSFLLNNRSLGEQQNRVRRITFGTRDGRRLQIDTVALENPVYVPALCGHAAPAAIAAHPPGRPGRRSTLPNHGPRIPMADALRLQGLPDNYARDCPFKVDAMRQMLSNGVPLPMGRAVAAAIRRAIYEP